MCFLLCTTLFLPSLLHILECSLRSQSPWFKSPRFGDLLSEWTVFKPFVAYHIIAGSIFLSELSSYAIIFGLQLLGIIPGSTGIIQFNMKPSLCILTSLPIMLIYCCVDFINRIGWTIMEGVLSHGSVTWWEGNKLLFLFFIHILLASAFACHLQWFSLSWWFIEFFYRNGFSPAC